MAFDIPSDFNSVKIQRNCCETFVSFGTLGTEQGEERLMVLVIFVVSLSENIRNPLTEQPVVFLVEIYKNL